MIQSDALSQQPDYSTDEDNDNDNMVMLPKNLFVNLIDLDLQKQIMSCDDMDKDATDALMLLLDQGPAAFCNGSEDWTVERIQDKNILFF